MADFHFENGCSLSVAFRGSDLSIRAAYTHPNGERVAASTFLYGSGKNMGEYATPAQNRLLLVFAPLARGDMVAREQLQHLAQNFAIEVTTARPGDVIRLRADDAGNINFHLKGQDMGFRERATIDINVITDVSHPNYPIFHALQSFMQNTP